MARPQDPRIVIRRRHLPGDDEEPHDGGTWKIAYADFVTAMMTFFLLMWLINVTTQEQKTGIADYFNPVALSQERSGADGMLSGRSVDDRGALTSPHAEGEQGPPVAAPPVVASVGEDDRAPAGRKDPMPHPLGAPAPPREEAARPHLKDLLVPGGGPARTGQERDRREFEEFLRRQAEAAAEQRSFERIERDIRAALAATPELRPLADSLVVENVPEGLRIQITDRPQFAMFTVGSARMNEQGRKLIQAVAHVLAGVPNGIAITGHTDALAYAGDTGYGNWELSSDRANAARRELLSSGLPRGRILRVEGRAELDHLVPADPLDPRNRRISITLLRTAPPPVQAASR